MYSPILAPIVALVAWTLLIMIWMMATRFAAMRRKGISLKGRVGGRGGVALEGVIEDEVNWKAHNYMHLVEQPTLFYAIALTLAIGDGDGGYSTILAWAYVGLRVLHSLVQTTVNIVAYRFILWALSSLALIGLTIQAIRMICAYLSV
ncbi:MAG TPA: MAPEG family protein [Allosphingosinicella sp.]